MRSKNLARKLFSARKTTSFKKGSFQAGFSLLEVSVVLVIIGLILGPAAAMYHHYLIKKDWEETEGELYDISTALGNFRAVYGRYPCPSPTSAGPGDALYGFEDCSAPSTGTCSGGLCAHENPITNEIVLIGSLPYKNINVLEQGNYDPNHNRYTYAVTLDQTDNIGFSMDGGGISIVDNVDPTISLMSPAGTAHFIVISHGKNGIGATSRSGILTSACSNGSAEEQLNCDNDSEFAAGGYNSNVFDDRSVYFSEVEPSEWQYSAETGYGDSIHLKSKNSVAIGAPIDGTLSTTAQIDVQSSGADSGELYSSGRLISEHLCEYGKTAAGDCFEPELLAGTLNGTTGLLEAATNNEGISCYDPAVSGSEKLYMVGIANKEPICRNEVFVTCSDGKFIKRVDADGSIVCNDLPSDWCTDKSVTTTCEEPATVTGTYSGGYSQVYSGECRMFNNTYDRDYFTNQITSMTTISEIRALVDAVNESDRSVGECGADYTDRNTQVRDSFKCTDGSWATTPIADEHRYYRYTFPGIGGDRAENTYNGTDMYRDNGNEWRRISDYHDCWCREEFRLYLGTCSRYNRDRNYVRIQKHRCPSSKSDWTTVYSTDEYCGCSDTTTSRSQTCLSYYNELAGTSYTGGLTGTVTKTYPVTCVGGNGNGHGNGNGNGRATTVVSSTPSNIEANCECPANDDIIDTSDCPDKTTNSWSWNGEEKIGIASLTASPWICPATGGITDSFNNFIPTPGRIGDGVEYTGIPDCECDSSYVSEWHVDCPSNLDGAGIDYSKTWDCNADAWGETIADIKCNACSYKSPTNTVEETVVTKAGKTEVGTLCSCDSDPARFCVASDSNIAGEFAIWGNCPCSAN